MNSSLANPAGPLPFTADDLADPDRRGAARVDCHTVVTAVAPQGEGTGPRLMVFNTHSEDVSTTGARLVSNEPLPAGPLYLRFLLPAFGDRYIEAVIVSENHRKRQWVTGKTTTVYVYGVRFTGVMTDDVKGQRIPSLSDLSLMSQDR